MRFDEWIRTQPHGTMKRLEHEMRVGYTTLQRLRAGERIRRYDIARRISDATGGAVTITDLCETAPTEQAP